MRKRLLTYSLALAMAVSMVAPQAAVLPASLRAVNVYAEETDSEIKATPQITQISFTQYDNRDCIQFAELLKYSDNTEIADYVSNVSKLFVNDIEYEVYYGQTEDNCYDFSWSTGLSIMLGAVVDGENTIQISADGYKDKKITINVNKEAATAELVSQTDEDTETPSNPEIDKTSLQNAITAAQALIDSGEGNEEQTKALQTAIDAAKEVLDTATTQEEITRATKALNDAIDAFNKKEDSNQGEVTNPVQAGQYTLSFQALTDEGESSMIQTMFDEKVKLTVDEDGKMKVSMLNTKMMDYLLDYTITPDKNTYVASESKDFGTPDEKGNYSAKEYTIAVDDISVPFTAAALVSAMGGQISDKGDISKYTLANLSFTSIKEGWSGYDSQKSTETDGNQAVIDALVAAGYDTDGDGTLSDEEWNNISGEIDLSNCNLTDISLLKKLPSTLTSLDVSNNNIKEIPKGLLDGKTNLVNFYIEGNYIKTLPEGLFKDTTNLNWISLASNQLTSIRKEDFAGLKNLTILDLTTNEITTIAEDAFKDLVKIEDMGLGTNKLSSLPADLLTPMANTMKSLSLYENEFTQIPAAVEKVKALESLSAFNNKITSVSNINFSKLPNLKTLNLKSNEITSLPSGMLAKNTNLESVDFFDNRITSVSADMFPKIEDGIHKLDLQLNEMSVVDPAVRRMAKGFNKQYPQKTALGFKVSQSGQKKMKWTQNLSVLDLMFWYDATQSDQNGEIADVANYKAMLKENYDGKNLLDILNDNYWDWDIVTEVQQKKADGTFATISKSTSSDKADVVTNTVNVKNNGTYRIKKVVYAGTSGVKAYRFTVYSNNVTVKEQTQTTQKKQNTVKKKVTVAKVRKLKVKNLSRKKVRLSWKKVTGANGYKVYRATKKNGKYKLIKTIRSAKTIKFTDKKVKKNKLYYYKVRAYKKANKKVVKGAYSSRVKIRVKR